MSWEQDCSVYMGEEQQGKGRHQRRLREEEQKGKGTKGGVDGFLPSMLVVALWKT